METTFRDIVAVVPSLAVAAMSQIAAGAISTAAQLLDEHSHLADVIARQTAHSTADITETLSNNFAQNAFLYANRSACAAQQTAEAVSAVSNTLIAAAEAAVHCATSRAQVAVRRQATSWQQYAEDQALVASQRVQDAVQNAAESFPGLVPDLATDGSRHSSARSTPTQPQSAPLDAAATLHGESPARVFVSESRPIAEASAGTAAITHTASNNRTSPGSQQLSTALAAAQAALADAQQKLTVKQVVSDIFRAVERSAAHEEASALTEQLQQSQADLHAAMHQLEAAAEVVAALPTQLTLLVQEELRKSLQEATVDREGTAMTVLEPSAVEAATAESSSSGLTHDTELLRTPQLAAVQPAAVEQGTAGGAAAAAAAAGVADETAAVQSEDASSSSDSDDSSALDGDFLMVDMPVSAGEGS